MDRSKFLECMAWCGTGVLYAVAGPGVVGRALADATPMLAAGSSFVQISDTHVGFHGDANTDVLATFQQAIDKINALPQRPEFVMHTGDLTHLSKPEQFDTVKQMLGTIKTGAVYAVPGEHDIIDDRGAMYFKMFGQAKKPWYSFDAAGVHALALTNVLDIKAGGYLGRDQLEWARGDLVKLRSNTPVVVFAHIPLFAAYPEWGWTTDDYLELLAMLRRFESVTVLNGHIHQVLSKVDGNVTFFTADSTAFPQPKPGSAPKPGPLKVPAGQLGKLLGIRTVNLQPVSGAIAVADQFLN
jgi:3',5'-cyclic AMP phosphodiesterase CpdA